MVFRLHELLAFAGLAAIAAEWGMGIGTPWLFYLGMVLVAPSLWIARKP